jgi:tetratricopeptide (TPR) repeat protein
MDDPASEGNNLFIQAKYSAAITAYTRAIESSRFSASDVAIIYTNRALANLHMELYRRCINDCNSAISLDKDYLQAYILKGRALLALDKEQEAQEVWKQAASITSRRADMELHLQLKALLAKKQDTTTLVTKAKTVEVTKPSEESFSIPPSSIASVAARGLVQHGSGDTSVDEKIALGYLQVNTGKYRQGVQYFDMLLKSHPRLVAAYLGRGTAYALLGDLVKATEDFSSALDIDPKCMDGWKRRGQTRSALGYDNEALFDLSKAAELGPHDHEVFHQRGLVLYKLRNYRRAMLDFRKAISIDGANKLSWNHLGLCLTAIGSPDEAIEAHKKAVALDTTFKEAWANIGQAYKELGNFEKAEHYFEKAIRLDKEYLHAFHLRAICKFSAGDHRAALADFNSAVRIDSSHRDSRHMRGVVQHGLGLHAAAVADYEAVLKEAPDHVAWYNREVVLYTHSKLDTPVKEFNMDRDMAPAFKEAWCKRLDPATISSSYTPQPSLSSTIPDVQLRDSSSSPLVAQIIEAARPFGSKLQLNCAGYMPNKRQHRSCGLAVLELAQTLRAFWRGSLPPLSGKASSASSTPHPFSWRDLYDIPIRWRQFSEPNDPVWWVDLLTPEQFAEGFGSHTPMITGQAHVVRYSPMAPRAVAIMKDILKDQASIAAAPALRARILSASDYKQLHQALNRDFWVVTPCHSTARPSVLMEGTRLTIQYSAPEGYEFSIRTPGTPPRWVEYDHEMTHIFGLLTEAVTAPTRDIDAVSDLILTLTFYWYNFMPLSRGTAAVGFTALLAMFLAVDIEISAPVPAGQQVDWEGILSPRPEEFIAQLRPWMYNARRHTTLLDSLPLVADVLPTLRSQIEALNLL